MLCVACGQKMRLVQAIPDDDMLVPGYEHHILDCPGCGETERRLVFRPAAEALTKPWTEAPATQPVNGRNEVANDVANEAPCADAPDLAVDLAADLAVDLAVVEPTASTPTLQPGRSAEPEQPSGHWQHRIENVRARLDDLRKRAELANQEARAAEQDEKARERFTEFWEDLATRRPSS
jgi:hypothetical protein